MRELIYKVTTDKEHIKPRTRQWAGMQYEDNATEVKFDLSELSLERALYRIDFNSAGAGYQPSENLVVESNTIRRAIPSYVTQYGGEVQVTAVITILDENGEATGTCLSYPVLIYFTEVDKDAEGSKIAEKNISESEASALDAAERAEKAAQSASESEEAAEEAKEKTELARRAIEEGSKFVFSGGDAFRESEIDLAVDGELSEFSDNPVENKVVTQSFSQQMQEINVLKESHELLSREIEALKENDGLHSKDIEELKADYIVEQGVSGIWTYRKWASGIAECWGTINIQFDKEVANKWIGEDRVEDSGFYGLGEIPQSNITFPFDFVETPLVDVVLQSTPCTVFIAKNSSNNSPLRNTGEIRVYRPLKFPDYVFDREFVFGYSVKGRWK